MLKWMKLKNLALVEEAEVVFGTNFNVISGETGAGKSVIMGGIGLLLGTRADKSFIRTGCDKCEISAEFDISAISKKSPLKNILKEYDLCSEDSGDALFIRRVITAASTRNYVNGVPASLQVLREIGRVLVDIHAANENQSLLDDGEQLAALDRYSGVQDKLKDCQQEWNNLKKLQEDKASFLASIPSEREISILKQELEEIESVDPKVGEDEELEKKHEVAGHAKTILEIASGVSSALTEEDESLVNQIASVRRVLVGLEHVDKEQGAHFVAELDGISESVSDLSMRLHDYASSVELNEMEFQAMEERMHVIRSLKRRYGPSLEEVLIYEDELKKKIVSFED